MNKHWQFFVCRKRDVNCFRKNAPWVFVQNPCAKEIQGDLEKAYQLWEELKRSQTRITAEQVKGMLTITKIETNLTYS